MARLTKNQRVSYRGCSFIYIGQTHDGQCLLRNIKQLDYKEMKVPCSKVYVEGNKK